MLYLEMEGKIQLYKYTAITLTLLPALMVLMVFIMLVQRVMLILFLNY